MTADAIPILGAALVMPFLLAAVTSFAKLAIVASAVRYALGTPKMPPNSVVVGVALVLSVHVMWPVVTRVETEYARLAPAGAAGSVGGVEGLDAKVLAAASVGPLADFLRANAGEKDVAFFRAMRDKAGDGAKTAPLTGPVADGFSVYAPAFVLTELTEAFVAAFLIFVPFFVIDLVVSSTLLAAGAHMLSPTVVSLPLKLLVFVMMDGWRLIVQGLVVGYRY